MPNDASKSAYTRSDLKAMQSWPLDKKVRVSQLRIMEWYEKWGGRVYVSFSGGKDSTVLLDLARRVCEDVPGVFVDTGLEWPEIRTFVKSWENIIWLKPQMRFNEVIDTYGYPVISKDVSNRVYYAQKGSKGCLLDMQGMNKDGSVSPYKTALYGKYQYLVEAPFKIGAGCCRVMKKTPCKHFEKESGRKPIVGTMACESVSRTASWLKNGCNAFDSARPISQPLSFWTEQDVLMYLKSTGVSYCPVYGDIIEENGVWRTTGEQRTGCMFCAYGEHLEKSPNKFERMRLTHPKIHDYCIRDKSEGGLGMGRVLDYVGIPY